jgi:hypothetical protein
LPDVVVRLQVAARHKAVEGVTAGLEALGSKAMVEQVYQDRFGSKFYPFLKRFYLKFV